MLELKQAEEACDQDPTDENIQKRECLKLRIESLSEYIVKGSIIRSRVNWYEQGEKNNKYFLNLGPVYTGPDEFLHGRILYLDGPFTWDRTNSVTDCSSVYMGPCKF